MMALLREKLSDSKTHPHDEQSLRQGINDIEMPKASINKASSKKFTNPLSEGLLIDSTFGTGSDHKLGSSHKGVMKCKEEEIDEIQELSGSQAAAFESNSKSRKSKESSVSKTSTNVLGNPKSVSPVNKNNFNKSEASRSGS
jgi:hypothetical protein